MKYSVQYTTTEFLDLVLRLLYESHKRVSDEVPLKSAIIMASAIRAGLIRHIAENVPTSTENAENSIVTISEGKITFE